MNLEVKLKVVLLIYVLKNLADKVDLRSNEPIKPVIWKQNNKVVYQFLETPKLPDGLDYCLTVYSMSSVLYLIYSQFLDPLVSGEKWRKAIETVDQKICTLILRELTEVLTRSTYNELDNELVTLLPTLENTRNDKNIKPT